MLFRTSFRLVKGWLWTKNFASFLYHKVEDHKIVSQAGVDYKISSSHEAFGCEVDFSSIVMQLASSHAKGLTNISFAWNLVSESNTSWHIQKWHWLHNESILSKFSMYHNEHELCGTFCAVMESTDILCLDLNTCHPLLCEIVLQAEIKL